MRHILFRRFKEYLVYKKVHLILKRYQRCLYLTQVLECACKKFSLSVKKCGARYVFLKFCTFPYPHIVKEVLFLGQIFKTEFFARLICFEVPWIRKNHGFSGWSLCVLIISITHVQGVPKKLKRGLILNLLQISG